MKEEAYSRIREILEENDNLEIIVKKKGSGNFKFRVYLDDKYKEIGIEALELSVRAENCLKRVGIKTIYDLMTKIKGRADLDKIRNCGVNSSRQIMDALFKFQYMELKPEQRPGYIRTIIDLNKKQY